MFATTQPPDRAFQKCKSGNRTLLLGFLQDLPEPQHSSLHLSQPEACKTGPCPSCSFLAAVHSGPCRPQAPQLTKHIPAPGPLHLTSFCLGCFPPGSLHDWLVPHQVAAGILFHQRGGPDHSVKDVSPTRHSILFCCIQNVYDHLLFTYFFTYLLSSLLE